ncbi:helix-turn-helix domain-containing protein [Kocuria sp. NPDC057446]|uniref:helix-turn-helix domain-containing protein n=1 Tax=Kocuria sp. NPDC057446 TaxID=3346137 RepID=UPI0036B6BDF5
MEASSCRTPRTAWCLRQLAKLAHAAHRRESGHTVAEIVANTGITRTTLYRHLPPRPAETVTAGAVTAAESEESDPALTD